MKAFLSFFFLLFLMLNSATGAADEPDQNIASFLTGKKLELKAKFLNNLFAVGNSVVFNGSSEEDIFLIGLNVSFGGSAAKDVYLCGDTVKISGRIKGILRVVARRIVVDGCVVDGNVQLIAPDVRVMDGTSFKKYAKIWANQSYIGGKYSVLAVKAKEITFSQECVVTTQLNVQSEHAPSIPQGILRRASVSVSPAVPMKFQRILSLRNRKIYSYLSLCFPFLLMSFFMPRLLGETVRMIEQHPGKMFATGVFALFLIPLILLIFMLTVVGAPLGVIFLVAYVSMVYLCRGFAAAALGRVILRKMRDSRLRTVLAILLGLAVFVTLTSIPKVSYVFQVLFIVVGFGGLVSGRVAYYLRLRRENAL